MVELVNDRRGWMNRSRGFAEGVVVMICPVLLALALNKVDLNSEVYGRVIPVLMLVIASVTLISGICPLLACCFLERFPGCAGVRWLAPVATSVAPVSSTCLLLLVLTCWMAQLVVSTSTIIHVGGLFGPCVVVAARTAFYDHQYRHRAGPNARHGTHGEINAAADDDADQLRGILDSSLEFLSAVTGILFLGLEGMALEGHNQIVKGHGRQLALGLGERVSTISFFVCALGVFVMFLEMMIPSRGYDTVEKIVDFTLVLDGIMATGTVTVLMAVLAKFIGYAALVLLAPPFMMLLEYSFHETPGGAVVADAAALRGPDSKPASLGLTRVTFTGFLAVSVTAISGRSPSMLTNAFLLFAAVAIVFGLSWRLLSQEQIRRKLEARANRANSDGAGNSSANRANSDGAGSSANRANSYSERVASSANIASFCAHFCIVIATVLLAVMAGVAGDAKEQNNNAPAPHAGNGTANMISSAQMFAPASHAGNGTANMISSAQMFAPAHVITGCASVIFFVRVGIYK